MQHLPISGYHSYEQYVEDLERAESFYTKTLGFKVIGRSTPAAEKVDGMTRRVLAGGKEIHLILSKPIKEWSVAAKYLKRHPEGIAFLNFRTDNLDAAKTFLEARDATFLYSPIVTNDGKGQMSQFAIATAIDDVSIRFIDDHKYSDFGPGFQMDAKAGSYTSPHGFECIDHMTINVKTLQPLIAFYKGVLGFTDFWRIDFHTNDVNPNLPVGSGLKSKVVCHQPSGVKFANNEPAPPYFRNSQIDIYLADNNGSGIQHVALKVPNIIETMAALKSKGGSFLEATPEYYERVDPRLRKNGFTGTIKEDRKELMKHSILIDANEFGYLLQVFSKELERQLATDRGGPMFYEIIQREGDEGFGGGNFRALFETIEMDQIAMEKTAKELPLEVI